MRCDLPADTSLAVVLVDDGSQDGTGDAVLERFPAVRVIRGNGSLYWNGGMRLAYLATIELPFDDYLWLNDDTMLDPQALSTLWACREQCSTRCPGLPCIVVGATRGLVPDTTTYGGWRIVRRWPLQEFSNIPAAPQPQPCDTFNGNCALIPRAIAQRLGNLEARFIHSLGDLDYGFRAVAAGFPVWQAPGTVGVCPRNVPAPLPPDVVRSVRRRLQHLCGAKQVPPKAWFVFVRRNYGIKWPIEFARPYVGATLRALRAKWTR